MRFTLSTFSAYLFVVLIFTESGFAQEKYNLKIFRGVENDFCPGGYSDNKECEKFNPDTFTKIRRGLEALASYKDLAPKILDSSHRSLSIALDGEVLRRVRRYRDLRDSTPLNRQAVLVVLERTESNSLLADATGSIPKSFKNKSEMDRRRFTHGAMAKLDPEEQYPWMVRWGKIEVFITFNQ